VEKKYEVLPTTADVGLIAYGKDLVELFKNAAEGMFDLVAEMENVKPEKEEIVDITSPNLEELLVAWLNELILLFDARWFLAKEYDITELNEKHLKAVVKGETYNAEKHAIKTGIKGATYHKLEVKKINDLWRAQVIFDV
jgi:SHS2 domain-containing protein